MLKLPSSSSRAAFYMVDRAFELLNYDIDALFEAFVFSQELTTSSKSNGQKKAPLPVSDSLQ
jgi:hypothetical protein